MEHNWAWFQSERDPSDGKFEWKWWEWFAKYKSLLSMIYRKYPRNGFPRIEMLLSVFQRKTPSSNQTKDKSKSESTIFSFF